MKRAFLHLYKKSHASHLEVTLFGEGLKRHGWQVEGGEAASDSYDLLVQWGVRVEPPAAARETCILETSYIEPRADYCSIGFGHGINNRLDHYGPFDDQSRLDKHFKGCIKPWKIHKDGRTIIMGQCPGDMALKGHEPFFYWLLATYRTLKDAGRDVVFRAHPVMNARQLIARRDKMRAQWKHCVHADEERIWTPWFTALDEGLEVMMDGVPLHEALKGAQSVVVFNSNSGVDSVLSGVPTVTMDPGAMAYPVTPHDPVAVEMLDREKWACWLAWCQYTHYELKSGYAWESACPPHMR